MTEYLKSEKFEDDLGKLTRSSYMLGFTTTINLVTPRFLEHQLTKLKAEESFHLDAAKLANRMVEDIWGRKVLLKGEGKL